MADGTVTIEIKADGKSAEKSIQGIKGVFEGLGNHVKNTTSKVTDMVKAFGLVKLAQAGFNLLKNSMDGAIKRLDTMRNSERVFENMGFGAEETARMMENLNGSIKGLPTPLDSAVRGVQQLASSTRDLDKSQSIYSSLNNAVLGFGGSNEDVERTIQQFSRSLQKGKVQGDEFNTMMDTMGPVMNAVADEMGYTIGELQDGLSKGSIDIDDFTETLLRLNTDGGGGLASLQKIAKDATGGIQTSMANMRTAVSRGLANMIESIDEALIAANFPTIGEMISKIGETIEGALNKASGAIAPLIGWLATLFTTVKNSTAFQTFKQVIVKAFETGKQMISDFAQSEAWGIIKDVIKQVADAILSIDFGEVIVQIGEFIDKWSPLIAGITGAIAAFKIISGVIATVTAVKTALATAIGVLGGAFAFLTSPIGIVVAIIGALIAIGVALYKNWDEINAKAIEVWTAIADWFTQVWENISTGITEAWEAIKEYFSELWTSIGESLTEFWEGIKEFFTEVWNGIQEIFTAAWEVIKNIVFVAIGIVATVIEGYFNTILNITSAIWDLIGDYILGAWEFIKTTVTTVIGVVKSIVTTTWNIIKDISTTVWNAIKSVLTNVWNSISSVITTVINVIKNIITNAWNSIKSVTTSVWNGIKSVMSSVWNAIQSVITSAINAVKSIITNVWNSIKSTTSNVWNGIKSTISNILNSIKSTFSNIFNSLRNIVSNAFNRVKTAVSTGMNNALSTVTNFLGKFKDAGKNIVGNIADGITGAIGKVTGAIGKVTQKIRDFLPFSPPKDKSSPLADIHKNGIGTQIAKGIDGGEVEVQQAMHHLLDVPDINKYVPQFDIANTGSITNISQNYNTYDDTNVIALLQRIANKETDLYIDDRVLIGRTKDKYNQEFGNDLDLRKRGRS